VDIHPIAVLITRLRLFIALIDERSRTDSHTEISPLPNLETRCITADTLSINLNSQYVLGDDEWEAEIGNLRAAREMWTTANHPNEKDIARTEEHAVRSKLRYIGNEIGKAQPDLAWLGWDFLSASASPARHDIRELFPAPKGGWDIVIGNPPYQKPDPDDKARGKRLGYVGNSANLYLMFIEAVMAASREGGSIVLIVPHSIVFRTTPATYPKVRSSIQQKIHRISIRTYDNAPLPVFPIYRG